MEYCFQTWSDLHHYCHLCYPVEDGRYAQWTLAAIRLRYLHLQHGLGHVAATAHAIPQLVQVLALQATKVERLPPLRRTPSSQ